MKAKLLILISVILIVAVAGVVWVGVYGWPPIIRDKEYRELIRNFHQAQPREKQIGDENVLWDFQIEMPEKQISVGVRARPSPGVTRLKYKDEESDRALYKLADYSHPQEIRIAENILYVHWTESLLGADHWLIAYDLVSRREIVRRKIDPDDLKQSH